MLSLTNADLRAFLLTKGLPASYWHLQDWRFETVHDGYVGEVWQAWIDSLRKNAPQCLQVIEVGGGKTRSVPHWEENAGDCENIAMLCFAHAQMGNWINARAGGAKVGRTLGITFFVAVPRLENRMTNGNHAQMWYINHEGELKFFEPALGETLTWLPQEYSSATIGMAA